jgi:DNA-directed RNA polymerase specialized sigma24 family protein
MPTKKQAQTIRPELIEPLTEILRDRGLDVRHWPADEAAAYRNNGRFQEGRNAVDRVRMAKAAAAIEEAFRTVVTQAYIDGISAAQAMTGFTDETFRDILAKEGIAVGPDGRAL